MNDRTDEQERDEERGPTTADLVREADGVDDRDDYSVTADRLEENDSQPLFEQGDTDGYRARWQDIQAAFVDEPRRAVAEADSLVAELMQRLAETFSSERSALESQWDRDEDVSTEDLRLALQRYRSFFDRLLSA